MPPHFWHVVAVVTAPALIIAGFRWYDRVVDRRDAAGLPPWTLPRGRVAVAAASGGAGLIHAAVCPEHFREATSFGLFFAVASAAQIAWAGLHLRRPSPALWTAAVVGNAAVIALWLVSRTVGVPVGPEPGAAESIGLADVAATLLELAVIGAGVRALVMARKKPLSALTGG